MYTPPRSGAGGPDTSTATADARAQKARPLTRMVEGQWLTHDGEVRDFTRLAPATALFDEAFSAVARGSLIETPNGPVAVEDLLPGDRVITDIGAQPLLWVGRMMVFPGLRNAGSTGLIRLTVDSLGYARPAQDLLLADHARIVHKTARCRDLVGQDSALAPARAFVDGLGVIPVTPPSPVLLFQLGFKGHRSYIANGIRLESVHPGQTAADIVEPAMLTLFLSFFPHLKTVEDFGPLVLPRLTTHEVEGLLAA